MNKNVASNQEIIYHATDKSLIIQWICVNYKFVLQRVSWPNLQDSTFAQMTILSPISAVALCSTEPFNIFSRKLFSAKQTNIWINPQYTHSVMSSPVAWLVLSLFHVIYSLFSCFILKPSSFQLLHFQPLFPACGIAYPTLISFTCPSLTFPP